MAFRTWNSVPQSIERGYWVVRRMVEAGDEMGAPLGAATIMSKMLTDLETGKRRRRRV